jgi:hypothetical protein
MERRFDMLNAQRKVLPNLASRGGVALLLLLAALLAGARATRGGEVIPYAGLTKPVGQNTDASLFGGVAFRGDLMPFLKDEIGIAYSSESPPGGLVKRRMWPVTASLWFTPVPLVYGGGGVGWYNVTYDYNQNVLGSAVRDETKQQFGVHVGGGLRVPLTPAASVDLSGRYVMMRDQQSRLVPQHFDPDFWTATLGLGIHF